MRILKFGVNIGLLCLLAVSTFAQDFSCGAVRVTPFGAYCFENSDYTGRVRSLGEKPPTPKPVE